MATTRYTASNVAVSHRRSYVAYFREILCIPVLSSHHIEQSALSFYLQVENECVDRRSAAIVCNCTVSYRTVDGRWCVLKARSSTH